jgi:ATP-dependent RNA helicase RhlE
MTFQEMNLIAPLLQAVRESGYEKPTPIQQSTIPLALAGDDILGCAQTGTGKTAAFALPILQKMAQSTRGAHTRPIRALILTPTRELAQQIYDCFLSFGARRLSIRVAVIYGGVSQVPQAEALKRGVDILVATPGRLNDLVGQGLIRLDGIDTFVLDEADRMLDMGFIRDVKKIIALLSIKRQTLFFSATMPAEAEELAMQILKSPKTVKVDPVTRPVDSVRQSLYYVDKANKKLLLAHLLADADVESALVFVRTRHGADRVVRELSKAGIESLAIHGSKSQGARQTALSRFKSGELKTLVATDIAARGIDITGLSHVFNYDLPDEPEAYIHRIGRTGRAGLSGDAISFCCVDELKNLRAVEALIGKRIPTKESPWPMVVTTPTKELKAQQEKAQPSPKKLNMRGEPLEERPRRGRFMPASKAGKRR